MAPCSSVAFLDDADGNGITLGHALTTSRMPARAAAADASPDGPPAPPPPASMETRSLNDLQQRPALHFGQGRGVCFSARHSAEWPCEGQLASDPWSQLKKRSHALPSAKEPRRKAGVLARPAGRG